MTFTKNALFTLVITVFVWTGCSKSDEEDFEMPPASTTIKGSISQDIILTADKKWTLEGYVYITNGATLTIEPGTVIVGSTTEKAALCVERGAKIIAEGTAEKPIVFTSGQPVGQRAPGDWGGLVILGKAPTNRTATPTIEGGLDRPFGGNDPNDNSGILKFVRIEFAGIAAFAGSEINGLTLGGVGAGTTIENIQISYGNDDGFEFFGGTVNAKRLVSFATSDDDFDFDFGYIGNIQYGIALKDPNTVDNGDDNNGIESDNDGSGTDLTPYTKPVLSNFTFVGPNNASTNVRHKYGNRFRRASRFIVKNSIIMGYQQAGISLESNATAQSYVDGNSIFSNNIVHAIANPLLSQADVILTSAEFQLKATSEGNSIFSTAADIKLIDPFNLFDPNFQPNIGSPALQGANYEDLGNFFTVETFRGAVGEENWLDKWTSFTPKTNAY